MKRPIAVAGIAGAVLLVGVAYHWMKDQPPGAPPPAPRTAAQGSPAAPKAPPSAPAAAPALAATPAAPAQPATPEKSITPAKEDSASTPTTTALTTVDPESQPRAFRTDDYKSLSSPPAGYTLTNVVLTPEGFALDPNAPEVDGKRVGMLESAAKPLEFPSNAFVPMWQEDLPDGTSLAFEYQVSPDGSSWGEWTGIEVDEESMQHRSATMPDGSPNPNAAYVLGGLHAWPVDQWKQIRYRVVLASSSAKSPVLGAFRIYYMDSTLGEGRPAVLPKPDSTPKSVTP